MRISRFKLQILRTITGLVVLLIGFASCSSKKQIDLIVHNAVVYTVDSSFSTAQAFAIVDGKFLAVGTNDFILTNFEAKQTIDAGGMAVYPGFIDSHCHFYGYGEGLQEVDLVGTTSFEEVIQRVQDFAKTNKSEWIVGRGWDQNDWEVKEYPDRFKLDSLFPTTPVFIERIDGHAALANATALRKANINEWKMLEGGRMGVTKKIEFSETTKVPFDGLSGILVDNAVDIVKAAIPKPTKEKIKNSLLAAQKNCFAVGLTTVDDAGLEKKIVESIDELQKSGELKIRVYAMLTDNQENKDYYLKAGPYKTERLNVRSFKFYADGALGSRGACLLKPYTDKPEGQGFLLSKQEHFDSAATLMMSHGFQMNTHCIGDSANSMILGIYLSKTALFSTPKDHDSFRWRIEHVQVVDWNMFRNLNKDSYAVVPSVQPTHATSDMYWAKDRLGTERVKYAYAYNDLLKAAGMLALGTDFPVENINPMYTFYAAVARKDLKGFPEGGFQMENALSRENTLKGMTTWGAFANFEEKEKGSIEMGKFADFVITDKDIMKCDINEVPNTKVVYTFVNGEKVYEKK